MTRAMQLPVYSTDSLFPNKKLFKNIHTHKISVTRQIFEQPHNCSNYNATGLINILIKFTTPYPSFTRETHTHMTSIYTICVILCKVQYGGDTCTGAAGHHCQNGHTSLHLLCSVTFQCQQTIETDQLT